MPVVLADRVRETTTTTGTGTLNLGGTLPSFQSFVDGVGDGNQCPYTIKDDTNWEVGIGTVTAGSPDTLSRDTILASSNSDAAVNWGSGTRDVFLNVSARSFPDIDISGDPTIDVADGSLTYAKMNAAIQASLDLADSALQDEDLNEIDINFQSGTAYTFVLADGQNRIVQANNASAQTYTVPANSSVAYPIGTKLFVTQMGAGTVTIAPDSGVTINTPSGLDIGAQYATICLYKHATDSWVAMGNLS